MHRSHPPSRTASVAAPSSRAQSLEERIAKLAATLETANSILQDECRAGDKFGSLAFALLEKEVVGLQEACDLIRPPVVVESSFVIPLSAGPEPRRSNSRPQLHRIATSDEALRQAVLAHLPRVAPAPEPILSRAPSHEDRHRSSRTHEYDSPESFPARTDKPPRKASIPVAQDSDSPLTPLASPPPPATKPIETYAEPTPIQPPTAKERMPKHDIMNLFRRPTPEIAPVVAAPIVEERRSPSVASSSRRKKSHAPVTSDSEVSSVASRSYASGSSGRKEKKSRRREHSRRRMERSEVPEEEELRAPPKPPTPEPEPEPEPEPVVLKGEKVYLSIARALFEGHDGRREVVKFARVSRESNKAANKVLYANIDIRTLSDCQSFDRSFSANPSLGTYVHTLRISPLDRMDPKTPVSDIIIVLKSLLSRCSNLKHLDENFTTEDWDVGTLDAGTDYPLTPSSTSHLITFSSAKCWWELAAVTQLLESQPSLRSLTLDGAAMDRDWSGATILTLPRRILAPSLTTLNLAQIVHSDTLGVLLRACGDNLTSLAIGFQVIGATEDDTPRSSIPQALSHVSQSLRHFALRSPIKAGSEPTAGLLDDCLAVLPHLVSLSFSEQSESTSMPIASSKLLQSLPQSLKTLTGRGVIGFSTSRVLSLLESPEDIPVLEEVDLVWCNEAEEKGVWKERHVERIEEACRELGIRCRVAKGDEPLVWGLQEAEKE